MPLLGMGDEVNFLFGVLLLGSGFGTWYERATSRDPARIPRLVHKTGQFFFGGGGGGRVPSFNHAEELEFGVFESNETLMPRPIKIGQQAWQSFPASHLPRNDLVIKANTKSHPGYKTAARLLGKQVW